MLNRFQSPSEIALNIFGIDVYWYGIILAAAICIGFVTACKISKLYFEKKYSDFVSDYSPILIILGILGARFYYCIVNYSYYMANPLNILNIRQGGLSIHGMIIFGILGLYILSKIKQLSFYKLADIYLCSSLFAQSIGRWGNFFNSEAFGYPTNLPWKLFIPLSKRPAEFVNFNYFHPTFLYESLLDLIGFLILLSLFKKFSKKSGLIACCYLVIYSLIRLLVEHFRIDSALNLFNVPIAQIVSVVLVLLGLAGIIAILRKKFNDNN